MYVHQIDDPRALIVDGPVLYDGITPEALTSNRLADVAGSWEFDLLPDREREFPILRQNASAALARVGAHLPHPRATGGNLLDLGSGWGFFLAAAKEQGWSAYGLDPLPASAVYARATFGVPVVTDTLHDDTYPPAFFDVVTAFQVYEHLPNPGDTTRILHRIIRPGGVLLIEVPTGDTWTMRLLGRRHRHFVQDHLNFFSYDTLGRMLADRGFTVCDRYHPTRLMSCEHLAREWLHLGDGVVRLMRRTGIARRPIAMNIGDIITVIARRC